MRTNLFQSFTFSSDVSLENVTPFAKTMSLVPDTIDILPCGLAFLIWLAVFIVVVFSCLFVFRYAKGNTTIHINNTHTKKKLSPRLHLSCCLPLLVQFPLAAILAVCHLGQELDDSHVGEILPLGAVVVAVVVKGKMPSTYILETSANDSIAIPSK